MLASLTHEHWLFLVSGLLVASSLYALAADAIMGRMGFGVILTTVIAAGGGYGALMAIDWAILHNRLPYDYATPLVYAGGAIALVTLLLLVLCFLKGLIQR